MKARIEPPAHASSEDVKGWIKKNRLVDCSDVYQQYELTEEEIKVVEGER